MHSIRTRITLLNVIGMVVTILATTFISTYSVSKLGHNSSAQELELLCETGKSSINYYLKSVEQSTNTVSSLIDSHLDTIADDPDFNNKLSSHMEQAKTIFADAAKNTNGVLTYYYRLDPEITAETNEKGFWFVDLDGNGFTEHEVTDITDEENECIWFYEPKKSGKPIWLEPYITDTIDEFVVSYNVPVYSKERFIGVVGIEISYATLGKQIDEIKIQNSGFAYIIEDKDYTLVYHPDFNLIETPVDERPPIPTGLIDGINAGKHHLEYTYERVTKHANWLKLTNGMYIVVAVPVAEINEVWIKLIVQIVIVSVVLLAVFATGTIFYTRRITRPLHELTRAAEKINEGDYSIKVNYKDNNEIGVLAKTFSKLVSHLGDYIHDLNSLAYADSLTSVSSKNAFDVAMRELENKLRHHMDTKFAIAIFDCDDLKTINDKHGHDKGNIYLKNASNLISRVFRNSVIYRIGGDEFAIILENQDYENRENLKKSFIEKSAEICSFAQDEWEEIHVSVGIATFDPEVDATAEDVAIHADHLMYDYKREKKKLKN